MESLLDSLEPLLRNVYVHYGVAAFVGLVLGWLLRGLLRRPAPGPKPPGVAESPQPAAVADDVDVAQGALGELPGMTAVLADKLSAAGVAGPADLWSRGRDPDALHELADAVGLEDFVLRKWVSAADLMRLPGVTAGLADALIRSGVRSVASLANENPDRVQNKLAAYEEKYATLGGAPDRAAAVAMIEAAQTL